MIKFRGYVSGKIITYDLTGQKMVRIEIVEEKETPGPVVISSSDEVARLAREVVPLVQQLLKTLPLPLTPGGKITIPRVMIWLTEEEVEALGSIDVGDYVEISIDHGKIEIKKVSEES